MSDWIYVATAKRAEMQATLDLAENNLIVRPYYRSGGSHAANNHLKQLRAGDRLALAFSDDGELDDDIQTFEVTSARSLGYESLAESGGTDVFCFVPSDVSVPGGYEVDPELQRHTAICVLPLDPAEGISPAVVRATYLSLPNKQGSLFPIRGEQAVSLALSRAADGLGAAAGRDVQPRESSAASPASYDGVFIGVDFSGASNPRRTMWIAFAEGKASKLRISSLRNGLSHAELCDAVRKARPRVAVMDFPFGLSTAAAKNIGLDSETRTPKDAASLWSRVGAFADPWTFRDSAKGNRRGVGSENDQWRETDKRFKSTWAPTNLRLCSQTYRGMRDVLSHLVGDFEVAPWSESGSPNAAAKGLLLEGCPRSSLRAWGLPHYGYKGPDDRCRETRDTILRSLAERSGLVFERAADRDACLTDQGGDALDAVIMAVTASSIGPASVAAARDGFMRESSGGWIFTGAPPR